MCQRGRMLGQLRDFHICWLWVGRGGRSEGKAEGVGFGSVVVASRGVGFWVAILMERVEIGR